MLYDVTVITDDAKGIESVAGLIKELNGTIKRQTEIGMRSFVYPINKKQEGIYTVFIIELSPDKINELNKELQLEPLIIRHLVIKTKTIEAPKPPVDSRLQNRKPEDKPETQPELSPVKADKAEPKKTKPVKAPSKEETQERQEALNKKLEEILQEDK